MTTRRYVVDRREGRIMVLLDDADAQLDVAATLLPRDCREEGAILDVPLGEDGNPEWAHAVRNRAEEATRLSTAQGRLSELRKRDPGGDIEL